MLTFGSSGVSRVLCVALLLAGYVSLAQGQERASLTEAAPVSSAQAQLCESTPREPPCARLALAIDVRAGMAEAPYFISTLPVARGHGVIGVLAAALRLPNAFTLGGKLPLIAMNIQQPAGSFVNELALGNASFFLRQDYARERKNTASRVSFLRLTVAVPSAPRDDSHGFSRSRALALANALEAARRPEDFTSGVVPVVPALGHDLRYRWLHSHAELRLPLLFRFSDEGLPAAANPSRFAFSPVLHGAFTAHLGRRFEAALGADIVINAVEAVQAVDEAGWVQLSLTPAVRVGLGEHVALGVSALLPVGGALAGSNYSGNLSVATGF